MFQKYCFSWDQISIEGIACFRPIEVLEKLGLLSHVWWAGGTTTGDINPTQLFSLNFNSEEIWKATGSAVLKQTFQAFAKGKYICIF